MICLFRYTIKKKVLSKFTGALHSSNFPVRLTLIPHGQFDINENNVNFNFERQIIDLIMKNKTYNTNAIPYSNGSVS